jgi:O-antigen/teichoic acid export membrane protein
MYFKSLFNSIRQLSFFDTFKHASTYFSGTVLFQALGLVTLPFFTAYLTEDEYGIINVFASLVSISAVVLSFNIHWGTERYYHEETDDYPQFLATIFIASNVLFFFLAAGCLFFADAISLWLDLPARLIPWLVLYAYCAMLSFGFFNNIMIATKQSKRYTTVHVISQYMKLGAIISGILYWSYQGYENIYMAKIMAEGVISVIVVGYMLKIGLSYMKFEHFRWSYIKYAALYGIPLIPFALSNYLLVTFDQIYINKHLGHGEAGLYSFAYKIGMIYMGLGVALMKGASPEYYSKMNKKDYAGISQQVDSMVKLLVLGGCFLILYAVDVGTLLSSSDVFLAALPIAPVIVAAYLFNAIATFYNRGILYIKKNTYLSSVIMASVVINIILNLLLVPQYGYQAAAYTTLASYVVMMILSIFVTTYILKLPPLPLGRILKYIVFLAIVIAFNYLLGEPNKGLHIGWMLYKGMLFIILALALFYNKIGLFFNKTKIEETNDNSQ